MQLQTLIHVECAVESKLAGVVKTLNMDGQLSCPSFSRRVDLGPFFRRYFGILSGTECHNYSRDSEALLALVLRLVDGTKKTKYAFIRKLVVEIKEQQDLAKRFSIQALVQQELLLAVKEERHVPVHRPSYRDLDAIGVTEETLEAAKRKRAEIEPLFNSLTSAYEAARSQRSQIRAVQANGKKIRAAKRQTKTTQKEVERKFLSALPPQPRIKVANQLSKFVPILLSSWVEVEQ